jgi:putative FmdB family regulatory protein
MIYEYECGKHRWEDIRTVEERNAPSVCPECSALGHKVMSTPALHVELGYYDENLADKHSGEPFYVSSPGARERRRKELGLTGDAPISDRAKETKKFNDKRPVSISG